MTHYKILTWQYLAHYRNKTHKEILMVCTRWLIFFFLATFLSLSLGTELTLPTGVSTILLECLDEHTSSDSPKTYSSPETFRDDDLGENFWVIFFSFIWCRKCVETVYNRKTSGLLWCDWLGLIFAINPCLTWNLSSNLMWIRSLCNLNPTLNLKYSLLIQVVYWEWPTNVCSVKFLPNFSAAVWANTVL